MEDANTYLELGNNCDEQLDFYGNIEIHAKGMFYDCPLETLYLGRNLKYDYDYDHEYSSFNYHISPFNNKTELVSLSISNNVTIIGAYLFRGCSRLTDYNPIYGSSPFHGTELNTVIISNCVSTIETNMFRGCSAITSITIPNSVTSIKVSAFESCSALESITISNNVTIIEDKVFNGCCGLTNITIPSSVTKINEEAFNDCTSLKEVYIEDCNTILSSEWNDWHSTSFGEGLFYDCPLETLYIGRNLSPDFVIAYPKIFHRIIFRLPCGVS